AGDLQLREPRMSETYPGYDPECPDCGTERRPGKTGLYVKPCGMTYSEHKHWSDLRAEAKRKAREMVLKAREEALLPEAILTAMYEEYEREVSRGQRAEQEVRRLTR